MVDTLCAVTMTDPTTTADDSIGELAPLVADLTASVEELTAHITDLEARIGYLLTKLTDLTGQREDLLHQLWVERDKVIGLEAQLAAAPGNAVAVEKVLSDFYDSKAFRTTQAVKLPVRAARRVVRMASGTKS
jgi:chromosome segregation ATPase